ncbi:HAD family hydrolase [Candidatus Haliotispira prima]|uniref:HAD family hydrolase n=1 Tax=Candidatus Haliotispira prima TaxID=3034016 RepID=A0ABY8MDW7_9SPIO|nr:HAD family hydrolase [Candidatus Haliotispira prima]
MMNVDIRAVALDLDGTLLGPDHKVSPFTIKIINQLADSGIACIIATGRSVGVLRTGGDFPSHMYAVCLNGAQLAHLSEEQPLEETFLPEPLSRAVTETFAAHRHHLHAYVGEKLWCENANMELLGKYGPQFQRLKIFEYIRFADKPQDRILKFVSAGKEDLLDPILADLRKRLEEIEPGFSKNLYANYSMPGILEIQDSRMDKGVGLARILKRMDLGPEHLLAIGDGNNDVPMWELAKIPVVMSNSFEGLKQRGYYLAPGNGEDGAAQFLRAWFHLA